MTDEGRSRSSVKVSFAWYDLWVGVFVDRAKRTVYVCPLPCLLVTIRLSAPARVLPSDGAT